MKRLLSSVAVTSALVLSSLVAGQSMASARPAQDVQPQYTYGWVYLIFPTWLGNCPNGGNVTWIQAAVGPHDDVWSGGDAGDDIIYPKVALGQTNHVDAEVYCSKWPAGYYQYVGQSFFPSRTKESIWVGPTGWTHN